MHIEKTSLMNAHRFRITILVDNQAAPGLMSEHGLSLWIEAEDKSILFDTGQGSALAANASVLGVDLSEIDILVLSHGHYDHTGGIPQVLKVNEKIEAYCHPGVVQPRYAIRDGTPKPIQMPRESIVAINKLPAQRLHWVSQPLLLSERIGITGPIPRQTSYEDTGGPFFLDPEGRRVDPIDDDFALWIQTEDGLVICVGCCHAGLVNTLNHVRCLNKGSRVRAVIGGFHLLTASSQRIDQTLAALRSLEPDMVISCHCTGEHAVAALRDALRERVLPGAAGMTYRF
ncbi:MAG: MBL fold metallo-hydrolase [Thermodesulfobacteriota bacterium]|nr:MBL fold metallo-hydrolase [Thermodesulfobacteriota bacterium]